MDTKIFFEVRTEIWNMSQMIIPWTSLLCVHLETV